MTLHPAGPTPARVRLTGRGVGLAGTGTALAVGGHLVDLSAVALAGCIILAAPLASWLALRARPLGPRLRVRRSLQPTPAHAGQDVSVTTEVGPARPTSWSVAASRALNLGEAVPAALRGHAVLRAAVRPTPRGTSLHYTLRPRQRGRWPVGPLAARRYDALGLATATEQVGEAVPLTVWPSLITGTISDTGARSGLTPMRAGANDPSDEDTSLRTYQAGDDLRRVHWASAARHGELMVRTSEGASQAPVCVILDVASLTGGGEPGSQRHVALEWTVSVAASVAVSLLDSGHPVRLVLSDGGTAQAGLRGGDGQAGARWVRSRDAQGHAVLLDLTVDAGRREPGDTTAGTRDDVLSGLVGDSQLGEIVIAMTASTSRDETSPLAVVGGTASRRYAIVVPVDKTQDAVPTLLEHGWRATTLPVGGDLPAAWDQLTGGIR